MTSPWLAQLRADLRSLVTVGAFSILTPRYEACVVEIAGITGVPREAVKSRLRYARTKLAQWLADEQ